MELAAEQPGKPSGKGKAQSEPATFFARVCHVDVENPFNLGRQYARPFVLDLIDDAPFPRRDADPHGTPLRGILDGVPQQIDQDLLDAAGVRFAGREAGAGLQAHRDLLDGGGRGHTTYRAIGHGRRLDRADDGRQTVFVQPAQVQQVVDE